MEVKKMKTLVTTGMFSALLVNTDRGESEQTAYEQLESRPEIDDVICHYTDGDALKDALFVIDNIRDNDMKIKWFSPNVWSVQYRRKHVCDLRIENGSLSIGPISEVLVTRVADISYEMEKIEQLINALRNSMTVTQKAYALH